MAQEVIYKKCTFTPRSSVTGPTSEPRNDQGLRQGMEKSSQFAISGGPLPAQHSLSPHFAMFRNDCIVHVGN